MFTGTAVVFTGTAVSCTGTTALFTGTAVVSGASTLSTVLSLVFLYSGKEITDQQELCGNPVLVQLQYMPSLMSSRKKFQEHIADVVFKIHPCPRCLIAVYIVYTSELAATSYVR